MAIFKFPAFSPTFEAGSSSMYITEQDSAVFPAFLSFSGTVFELPQSPIAANAPGTSGNASTPFYKHHSYHLLVWEMEKYFMKTVSCHDISGQRLQ